MNEKETIEKIRQVNADISMLELYISLDKYNTNKKNYINWLNLLHGIKNELENRS